MDASPVFLLDNLFPLPYRSYADGSFPSPIAGTTARLILVETPDPLDGSGVLPPRLISPTPTNRVGRSDQKNTQAAAAFCFPRGLFSSTRNAATQMLILSALDGAKLQHPSACQADHLRFTPQQD